MEWIEVNPLPQVCRECDIQDCWECDHANERWVITEVDQLLIKRKSMQRAIERYQRLIKELDKEIAAAKTRQEERAKKSFKEFKERMKEEGIHFDK